MKGFRKNEHRTEPSPPTSFEVLFRETVQRRPHSVAVLDADGHHLSFDTLHHRALELARALHHRGVGPEVAVAFLLPQGIDRILTALAIALAGGVAVPLDPAYPDERLQLLLTDAGIRLLLTYSEHLTANPSLARRLQALTPLTEILDPRTTRAPQEAKVPPLAPLLAAAYCLYTSGSTGQPRPVLVSRGALAWYVESSSAHYGLAPGERVLQMASIGFDISVGEIYPTLATGATLVLEKGPTEASVLLRNAARCRITVLLPATALWHEMVRELERAPPLLPSSLRLLSFGGETVSAARLAGWWQAVGHRVRLVNGYGPTEATVEATLHELQPGDSDPQIIGRPVAGAGLLIADARLRPVVPGERGELCLRGPGLARGYPDDPATTAERFVPDPEGPPGGRLYRSGDRVRSRNGQVEILGRMDRQLKIRGFRVEPGEIEAALVAHPTVVEAAVVAREDKAHRRLFAFVVTLGTPPKERELRRFLAERLPRHLLPAALVLVGELPRNAHGKIDREALVRRPVSAPQGGIHQGRMSGLVEWLARLWERVLRLPAVGPDDDFFELGGDSILGIRIAAEARRTGLALDPADLFHHPTPRRLATVTQSLGSKVSAASHQAGEAPLTPVQRWFFEHTGLARPHHFNQSHLVTLRRPVPAVLLATALHHLVTHHESLRLRFTQRDGTPRQRPAPREKAHLLLEVDLTALPTPRQTAAQDRAGTQLQGSFDLARGPVVGAGLFHRAETSEVLLAVHHLAVDAVTWQILWDDLETAVIALEKSEEPQLARSTPFTAWAHHQVVTAGEPHWRRQLPFWLQAPSNPPLLPTDTFPGEAGPQNRLEDLGLVQTTLPRDVTTALLREVPAAYGTHIQEVLLTALVLAFEPWLGSPRLLVDVEGHGRQRAGASEIDLSRTTGWFTSTFPVWVDLRGCRHLGAALLTVRAALRRLPDHGIGFGVLRDLDPDPWVRRRLEARPAPEMTFNYLGQVDALFETSHLFRHSEGPRGAEHGRQGRRGYLLDVDGQILDDRLHMRWFFSHRLHRQTTVQGLAGAFEQRLQELVEHCRHRLPRRFRAPLAVRFPLTRRPSKELAERLAAAELRPGAVEDIYPLSPMQRGMLFHTLYTSERAVYFEQSAWTLRGPLDADLFRQVWQVLSERHAILRTAFLLDGEPLQAALRHAAMPVLEVDLRQIPHPEQALSKLLTADRRSGFSLHRPPLCRIFLVRTDEQTWRFVWSSHHVLLDGWSIAQLFDEFFTLYAASRRGKVATLPRPLPYREYIRWLAQFDERAAEPFWRRRLAGIERPNRIVGPASKTSDPTPFTDYRRLVDKATAERLKAWARRHRLTLNTLVQGAWALLLTRLTGEDDVLFGVTGSGRPAELLGADRVMGLLINTLPLRAVLDPWEPLLPWLHRLQEHNLELRRHEALPLDRIASWSDVPPPTPLFESLLVFENYPTERPLETNQERGELEITDYAGFSETNYPLTLAVLPGDDLLLELTFDPRRLASIAARRLLHRLEILLTALPGDDFRPLAALPELTPAEHHQLAIEWPAAAKSPAHPPTVIHALLEQTTRAPDRTAVVDAEGRLHLSYGAFLNRSGNLAAAIAQHNPSGQPVALLLESEANRVAAMIACLSLGVPYLPLDPRLPQRRRTALLRDAGDPLLVHRGTPEGSRELDLQTLPNTRRQPFPPPPHPRQPAYVIYTSGSTGRPKGVVIDHRALASYIAAAHEAYGIQAGDRVFHLASPTFDISVQEIFPTLAHGATLVLAEPALATDPIAWWHRAARLRITFAYPATPLWQELAHALECEPHRLPHTLRGLVFGGEVVRQEALRHWFQVVGKEGPLLVNGYGPTEATVEATVHPLRRGRTGATEAAQRQSAVVGRPLPGARALVVDRRLQPSPLGTAGELCLGGHGLAQGYFHRPGLTAERFVPCPWTARAGDRLYRTGDRARFNPQGHLELLGRLDQQLKVRGFRVEPGEIEAALRNHGSVEEALVVAREVGVKRSSRQLVAYVVPPRRPGPAENAEDELVERWRELHEEKLFQHPVADEGLTGWNSTYTDRPIPAAEMHAWLEETTARVLSLEPGALLEIGCGEGFLLEPLARAGVQVTGVDFSASLLATAQQRLHAAGIHGVQLEQRDAADLGDVGGPFDTVVINSVIQYFPSVTYLERVLQQALDRLAPGGRLFLGDLRNLLLFDTFCASVELYRAPASLSVTELRRRILQRREQERELLLHPQAIAALLGRRGLAYRAVSRPKEPSSRNELFLFRCDTVLEPGERTSTAASRELTWYSELRLEEELRETSESLLLHSVPDRRLAPERALERLLASGAESTLGHLQQRVEVEAMQPEIAGACMLEMRQLAEEMGWSLDLRCGTLGGTFDALFYRGEAAPWPEAAMPKVDIPLTNDPLARARRAALVSTLHHHLREELPTHMVPAHIVVLDTLPRLPSGKVDRRALPPPGDAAPEIRARGQAPRGAVEKTLAAVWSEVLGVPLSDRRADYFALGGDSILSIQVVALARRRGLHITPRQVFHHPTVADLARVAQVQKRDAEEPATEPEPRGSLPFLPLQRLFFQGKPPAPHQFNQNRWLRLPSTVDAAALGLALHQLGTTHQALRLRFRQEANGWTQRLAPPTPGHAPLTVFDLDALPAALQARTQKAIAQYLQSTLHLEQGPILRAALLRTVEASPQLLLTVHHLAVDQVSWGILLGDLATLLVQPDTLLQPPPIPFATWARRQAQENPLTLPVARIEGKSTRRVVEQRLHLPPQRLNRAARRARATVDELLLTALARAAGHALEVDLESHGRDAPEATGLDLTRTVGWLASLRPVHLEALGEDPLIDLLGIKDSMRHGAPPSAASRVLFGYLGRANAGCGGSLEVLATEVLGEEHPSNPSAHALEIDCWSEGERFAVRLTHHENDSTGDPEALASDFLHHLESLVVACLKSGENAFLADDFPLAGLDTEGLSTLRSGLAEHHLGAILEDAYPLAPTQEGMLFHHRLEPRSSVYYEQLLWPLQELDVNTFRQAWSALLRRHPVLRTAFIWQGLKQPLQAVLRHLPTPFVEIDLRGLPGKLANQALNALRKSDRRRGFDPRRAPLLRLLLLRFRDRHLLLWSSHHLLFDGWSTPLLLEDLLALYRREAPPPPRPYRDFVAWLAQRDPQLAEAFLRPLLASHDEPTLLPSDRPASDREGVTTAGDVVELGLPLTPDESDNLEGYARRNGLTLANLVQGAWALTLGRAVAVNRVLFGVTLAGRPEDLEGVESMVGLFINTLPLAVELPVDASLRTWLLELRDLGLGLLEHQHLPLPRARELSVLPPGVPFFESIVVFESYPAIDRPLEGPGGGTLRPAELHGFSHTNYPLTLMAVAERPLSLYLLYDPRRFDSTTAQRLLSRVQRVLVGLTDAERLGEISTIGAVERHQVLKEWSTAHSLPKLPLLPEALEALGREDVEEIAVCGPGATHTSRGILHHRARARARALVDWGLRPGDRVMVSLAHGVGLLEALWALLAAGVAYVPLDSRLPRRRRELLLRDARPKLLLTDTMSKARLEAAGAPLPPIRVLEKENLPTSETELPRIHQKSLAYILYTSGSTGEPKGVGIDHQALADFLRTIPAVHGPRPGDNLIAITSLGFDISILELWGTLLAGARLVLARDGTARDGHRLAQLLERERITLLQTTPAVWSLLLAAGWQGRAGLRGISGGEALSPDLALRLLRRGVVLRNLYGPTEATVWSHGRSVARKGLIGTGTALSLGYPLPGRRSHVLDRRGRPLPMGTEGELLLGGSALARGYLERPALTAERFVPDPWGEPGERLYRTGDRVRLTAAGEVLFLGRLDRQLKIRGVRLERGEIESVLEAHPRIHRAAVVEAAPGELVAALVPTADAAARRRRAHWRRLWDATYTAETVDPTFDTTGWRSSFDSRPLPAAEMREWLDGIVEKVLATAPRRVLEIGCGTGMVLFRVAPHCSTYLAIDPSSRALNKLEVEVRRQDLDAVRLYRAGAHQLHTLRNEVPAEGFDAVVMSSVSQYLASPEVLAQVLRTASKWLAPGGRLLVADVRSLPLFDAFCCAVELTRAHSEDSAENIAARARERRQRDEELLLDPAFFRALDASRLRFTPHTGRARNEMQRFRFHVELEAAGSVPEKNGSESDVLDWRPGFTIETLEHQLVTTRPIAFRLRDLPDARSAPDLEAVRRLRQGGDATAAQVRTKAPRAEGLEPADLLTLGQRLGYTTVLVLAESGTAGRLDLHLAPIGEDPGWIDAAEATAPNRDNPLAHRPPLLLPFHQVRRHLTRWLPEVARPGRFLVLDELPLTAAGKVDHRRLAERARRSDAEEHSGEAPREGLEKHLATLWKEVLGRRAVGRQDHFFALGGHSLTATALASRIASELGIEAPLSTLFDHPVLADQAQHLAASPRTTDHGPRRGEGSPHTLSFTEERLLFLARLEPHSPAYNLADALRLEGSLDPGILQTALLEMTRRHPVLARTYGSDPPHHSPTLPMVDLTHLGTARAEREARHRAEQESMRPFDLLHRAPQRTVLLRIGREEHLLCRTTHHIATDAWSERLVYRTLESLYNALSKSQPLPPEAASPRYVDFAHWQRQRLEDGHLNALRAAWHRRLAPLPSPLQLHADHPRRSGGAHRGAEDWHPLDTVAMDLLEQHAGGHGATLFMALFTLFTALLHRLSGAKDLVIGTPVAGRSHASLNGLLGCFVNSLPLRIAWHEAPHLTLDALLEKVRRITLEALEGAEVPFEKLVEDLAPERRLDTNPLFQVLFTFDPEVPVTPQLGAATGRFEPMPHAPTDFEPSLGVLRTEEGGWRAVLEYDPDLFDATTIARWLRLFARWLVDWSQGNLQPIHHLDSLAPSERHQLLREWAQDLEAPTEALLPHVAFAQRALRQANGIALVDTDGAHWSASSIDHRVNALAERLLRAGAGPERPVAVQLPRDVELPIALLAILKSGAPYLPLALDLPEARLGHILEEARVSIRLTAGEGQIRIERIASTPAPSYPRPENAAYILFTSGSTGRPKGVIVTRHALATYCRAAQDFYGLGSRDRVLQLTSPAFDFSVAEIFPILAAGGCLVLGDRRESPAEILRRVTNQRVTVWMPPTALFHRLTTELAQRPDRLPQSLDRVIIGGEALNAPRLAEWHRILEQLERTTPRLINSYGPTEATVEVAIHELSRTVEVPPVGRPLPGAELYVVDRHLRLLPPGVPGELVLGGVGLARGYLGAPALTARAFVPHALAHRSGERLYRSGDRARHRLDGVFEILGRLDRQVKVRGFRVEPGELEAVLAGHPAMAEAAVVVCGPAENQRLEAFTVVRPGRSHPGEAALRAWLREHLPDYLVPVRCHAVDSLPRTSTGKLHRAALLQLHPTEERTEGTPPRTPTEEILAGLWANLLELQKVHREHDFFTLGGHSLAAIRLVARIRQTFGIELPLRSLFEHPELAAMAHLLDQGRRHTLGAPPLRLAVDAGPFVVQTRASLQQERLWLAEQIEPAGAAYSLPAVWHITGSLEAPRLADALTRLVERHEPLRTVFTSKGGHIQPRTARPTTHLLPTVDLAHLPPTCREEEERTLANEFWNRPFDLARGPILLARLLRLGAQEHRLWINLHHIAADGWSEGILRHELGRLYRGLTLPPLEITYTDFARWQHHPARQALRRSHLAWWHRHLEGTTPTRLPADRSTSAPARPGAALTLPLARATVAALEGIARSTGSSLFLTLLAAYLGLLTRFTGTDDIILGTPAAGRTEPATESLVGLFVYLLPLRARPDLALPWPQLVADLRNTVLEALDHQDLPLEELVEVLCPEREGIHNPFFRLTFTLQNEATTTLDLGGPWAEELEVETLAVRFDLELYVERSPEGLTGHFLYDRALFDATTVHRLARAYATVLEALAEQPEACLHTLLQPSRVERHQLLEEWSRGPVNDADGTSLPDQLRRQVLQAPDRLALIDLGEGSALLHHRSLGSLLNEAENLSHRLRHADVELGTYVAVLVGRRERTLIALLATLLAGATYVPIDPSHPRRHLEHQLAALAPEPTLLLADDTGRSLALELARDTSIRVLGIEATKSTEEPPPGPPSSIPPAAAAYVLHTSGSSGPAKGVVVSHRALAQYAQTAGVHYDLRPGERVAQVASFASDISIEEIFPPLLAGAALVLSDSPAAPADLLIRAVRLRIDALFLATAFWHELVDVLTRTTTPPAFPRRVCFGGERADPKRAAAARDASQEIVWINSYGPTEATVIATLHRLASSDGEVPIGRPIRGVHTAVVDRRGMPCPPEVPGELVIAGASLSQGYLHQPAETARRFVPDPKGAPGSRRYRTGDLVRWDSAGHLFWLGRLDRQLKLRGHRVEPAAIEAILQAHPAVIEAAVVPAGKAERRYLAAFVTSSAQAGVEGWRELYNALYRQPLGDNPTLDTVGWEHSTRRRPLPPEELAQLFDQSAQRILGLAPRRLLEIGCGTGLLLFRLAPYLETYLGTDFALEALRRLERHLAQHAQTGVELLPIEATEAAGERKDFDTAVLHSVTQYFPNEEYLLRTLEAAVGALAPGGALFVGDVRSLPLASACALTLELEASPDAPTDTLRRAAEIRQDAEPELLVHPLFWYHLKQHLPRLAGVRLLPRGGRARNELTRFRYDVVLELDTPRGKIVHREIPWHSLGGKLPSGDLPTRISGIPDPRLAGPLVLERGSPCSETAQETGEEPEDLLARARERGLNATLALGPDDPPGSYSLLLGAGTPRLAPPKDIPSIPLTNRPSQRVPREEFLPTLRRHLERHLPAPQRPTYLEVLDSLPRLPNGKLDRNALLRGLDPEFPLARPQAAASPLEAELLDLFLEVLGPTARGQAPGREDSFFSLGGHSLTAVRLLARLQELYGIEPPLTLLFEAPTVAALAMRLARDHDLGD